jgi:hypothetical protein
MTDVWRKYIQRWMVNHHWQFSDPGLTRSRKCDDHDLKKYNGSHYKKVIKQNTKKYTGTA